MPVFTLNAQVLGEERAVLAEHDGHGLVVITDVRVPARSIREALRLAGAYLGPFLHDADKRRKPWGLYVTVAGVAAVYGNWPLLPGPPSSDVPRDDLVSRIRKRYRDGSAAGALENAFKIIEAYTDNRGRAAA